MLLHDYANENSLVLEELDGFITDLTIKANFLGMELAMVVRVVAKIILSMFVKL